MSDARRVDARRLKVGAEVLKVDANVLKAMSALRRLRFGVLKGQSQRLRP